MPRGKRRVLVDQEAQERRWSTAITAARADLPSDCCLCQRPLNGSSPYLCLDCTEQSQAEADRIEEIATNERQRREQEHRDWIAGGATPLYGGVDSPGKY